MKKFSFLILIVFALIYLPLKNPVQANYMENPEAWKYEGIYTPLTPFESYPWKIDSYNQFQQAFAAWSEGMDQNYYQMDEDWNQTFNGYTFLDIVENATYEDYKIGFTYRNHDFRSDYDLHRMDIFAVYASSQPADKHLYIFGIDDMGKATVIYLDGDKAKDQLFDFYTTQNSDLKNFFNHIARQDLLANDGAIREHFMQLSQDQQQNFCQINAWYDIPNGICSDKGLTPDAHYEAFRRYGIIHKVDWQTAVDATYDPTDYEDLFQ